ncbi:hypothetical protein AAZX31_03G132200 [Glycine max]
MATAASRRPRWCHHAPPPPTPRILHYPRRRPSSRRDLKSNTTNRLGALIDRERRALVPIVVLDNNNKSSEGERRRERVESYEARTRLITGVSRVGLALDTHARTTPVRRGVRRRRRHRTRLNRRTPLVGRGPPRRHARRGPLRALGFFIIYFKMLTKKIHAFLCLLLLLPASAAIAALVSFPAQVSFASYLSSGFPSPQAFLFFSCCMVFLSFPASFSFLFLLPGFPSPQTLLFFSCCHASYASGFPLYSLKIYTLFLFGYYPLDITRFSIFLIL